MTFSAAELARMRLHYTAAMRVDTFTVQTFTQTSDSVGGQIESWSDETTGLLGLIEESFSRGSGERIAGEVIQEERRWMITLALGPTVTAAKRIKQTAANGVTLATPRIFRILNVFEKKTFDLDISCECVELPLPT